MSNFAIVYSEFNQFITTELYYGAYQHLLAQGIKENQITTIKVPGAVEIPLAAKLLAEKNIYQAIICLGAVIRGETSHYDYVCGQVSSGCQQVMLAYNVPVIFGVLTTENEEQAYARIGGPHGHKGIEAANVALEMVRVVADLRSV